MKLIFTLIAILPLIAFAKISSASSEKIKFKDVSETQSTTKTNSKLISSEKLKPVHIDYVRYEEHIFGRSSRSEIGDQMEFDFSVRKDFTKDTHMRFGFEIDPQENSLTTTGESKAQKFDMFFNHRAGNFTVQAELEVDTNKENTARDASVDFGGISLGFDDDSEGTFISYDAFDSQLKVSFYPFNFDSEVGDEFNTWDVARIYFIEGAPSSVSQEPSDDEYINYKTIPGFSLGFSPTKNLKFSIAGGITSFLYPSNSNFNIENEVSSSNFWEKKLTTGGKLKTTYSDKNIRFSAEHAWSGNDKQTGALLRSATSMSAAVLSGPLILSGEIGMSEAGRRPYRLAKGGRWFKDTAPHLPVYSDQRDKKHNWVGNVGFAYMAKVGLLLNDNITPYVYFKYQEKDFIFREDESAHNLRNFDDSLSHGGLKRIGFGSQFNYKNFSVKPDFEYRFAKNHVFSKSKGIQDDQINTDFSKEDFLFSVVVSYNLKDNSLWGWWKNQGEGIYGKASR